MALSKEEVTEDRLLGGRIRFRQPASGYRSAIDPVLLAAAVPEAAAEGRWADLGCGAGAASLCLAARLPGLDFVGVDSAPELVALYRFNAAANDRQGQMSALAGDIAALPLRADSFSAVICNPPYQDPARHRPSPNPAKARADISEMPLAAWIAASWFILKEKGFLALIHRADALDTVLKAALDRGFGSFVVHPVFPRAGQAAKRVILLARKGGKTPLILSTGLVLHGAGGDYTAEAQSILREGAPFPG